MNIFITLPLPRLTLTFQYGVRLLLSCTHFVGETTSKQKRRSMSSQCLTVHNLRSSTTTVGLSWDKNKQWAQTHWQLCLYMMQEMISEITGSFIDSGIKLHFIINQQIWSKAWQDRNGHVTNLKLLLVHQLIVLNWKPTPEKKNR